MLLRKTNFKRVQIIKLLLLHMHCLKNVYFAIHIHWFSECTFAHIIVPEFIVKCQLYIVLFCTVVRNYKSLLS